MEVVEIGESKFSKLFNERTYNPPDLTRLEEFDLEFDVCLTALENLFLASGILDSEYTLYEAHNSQRFIDVYFDTFKFKERDFLESAFELVSEFENDWMVCLWMDIYFFVTKKTILTYVPGSDKRGAS